MRAIIIEEDRFVEIRELMQAECEKLSKDGNSNMPERLGISSEVWEYAVKEAHRIMSYCFVRWAQSQGASCIRK